MGEIRNVQTCTQKKVKICKKKNVVKMKLPLRNGCAYHVCATFAVLHTHNTLHSSAVYTWTPRYFSIVPSPVDFCDWVTHFHFDWNWNDWVGELSESSSQAFASWGVGLSAISFFFGKKTCSPCQAKPAFSHTLWGAAVYWFSGDSTTNVSSPSTVPAWWKATRQIFICSPVNQKGATIK